MNRQSLLTVQCIEPELDTCSGVQRYLLARLVNELTLTSDLVCEQGSCKTEVAQMCLKDAMKALDFPVAMEISSELICR